jgi:transketolase
LLGDIAIPADEQSKVILSKGHTAAAYYAVLNVLGRLEDSDIENYCRDGARLGGHVTAHHHPDILLSTGSLGHGMPFATGLALGAKRSRLNHKVYVIMSDGECNEGTTWESALIAAHHSLHNLCVIVDRNYLQSITTTEKTLALEPFEDKWRAFGWNTILVDGHDHEALRKALRSTSVSEVPTVVIAETTKGYGVSFMENQVAWHYKSPTNSEALKALAELTERFDDEK